MTEPDHTDGEAMLDALLDTPGAVILRGAEAAAAGRAALEAAGVDLAALEARIAKGGRPRLDGDATGVGERAPRVNVSIPRTTEELLNERIAATGRSRSELVRDALTSYLTAS